VVLAIVILGLIVPPLVLQLGAGAQQQGAVLVQQNLTQLARERMAEIFTDHANPTRGYAYIQNSAYPTEDAPGGRSGYTRQTTIREVSPTDYVTAQPGSGIKRFRIVVTGPSGQSVAVESFVTQLAGAVGSP
jgi:type II secretory pathway pseudopilin PulG